MPKQLLQAERPVKTSIVEYDLGEKEEIFLSYTWERREGPGIERSGKDSPFLRVIGGAPGAKTSNEFGLRLGTWLIREEMRDAEARDAREKSHTAAAADHPVFDLTEAELNAPDSDTRISAHDRVFETIYPDHRILGQQGCGDLTMNDWNVAYINSPLGQDGANGGKPPVLVHLPREPLEDRTYSCLVKWKPSLCGGSRVTIEEVRFQRPGNAGEPNKMIWLQARGFSDGWLPRGDSIEFAVSNQQVIRKGELVPIVTSCQQFGDLRHLLRMPNLNPVLALYPGEPHKRLNIEGKKQYRPRKYFGEYRQGDIWFGEEEFLKAENPNLLRAALTGPVFLDPTRTGIEPNLLRHAFQSLRYHETEDPLKTLLPGQWRFSGSFVEVYFRRNAYAWTMIGLSEDHRRILCLACSAAVGKAGYEGYTLEEAAEILRQAGAYNALLVDEGQDVFQDLRREDGAYEEKVPRKRRRLRATFLFATPIAKKIDTASNSSKHDSENKQGGATT